ncbi:C10 family peptidase [Candidatus Fermentibacteria bacterium]|nr:C10 family peptidase [Candidatus Fermentibacteria bacterium]
MSTTKVFGFAGFPFAPSGRRVGPLSAFSHARPVVGLIAVAALAMLPGGFLRAAPVDEATAARVAEAALGDLAPGGGRVLATATETVRDDAGNTLAYGFEIRPLGFIIIAADDALPPVIAYSLHSPLHAPVEGENPLLALLESDLQLRLAHGQGLRDSPRTEIRQMWDAGVRAAGASVFGREFHQWPPPGTTSTGGWVATRWTQDPPYNNLCPVDPTTGQRSLAGCPAVAMAQILTYHGSLNDTRFSDADDYFHNYAGQYWIDDDHEPHGFPSFPELNVYLDTLTAHYESATAMTNTDKAAVVFGCGIAARQVYSSQGSGTFSVDQAHQAYLRFGHDEVELAGPAAPLLHRHLALNMIDALPAHLAVVTPQWNAGHNLVVDGYNTNGYYHLNFGWGGYADAWYLVPQGLPYNLTVIEGVILDIGSDLTCPDGNDEPSAAILLALEVVDLAQTICREGDRDWLRFYSEGGVELRMFTETIPGCELDAEFRLYGPHLEDGSDVDPEAFVASDDNSHGDLQPEISYTTPQQGYYFLRVACADPPAGGELIGAYLLSIEITGGLACPESLNAEVYGHDVHLAWREPAGVSRGLLGYYVYRDQQRITASTVVETEYDDRGLADGAYGYHVTAVYQGGESGPSNTVTVEVPPVDAEDDPAPAVTRLHGSYPNPSLGAVWIRYSLAGETEVTVTVHDLTGRHVRTLVRGSAAEGAHSVLWDGTGMKGQRVSPGIYVCRMATADYTAEQPCVLLR